ncbi:MAG: ABC transporter ATP-binding protein [Chloroflexota bacterium]|nr:ABC transporter ATP-binding protein [Chloroflexota bacterium]
MTVISLDHLRKSVDQLDGTKVRTVPIIDNVSLKISSGSVVAFLGPSGCGKSTLLRLVAGLIEPDGGRVLYDDVDVRQIPPENRGIGMVFQEGALIPHWSAGGNIGFFLSLRKREAEVPERVARISQITGIGLEKLLDRRPGQLSGGERQRVGIARALARDPRVFLFDEPFSNLDAKLRTQARVELKRLLHEFPVTSLYVTHDQVEAVSLADKTVVMRAGRFEQVGDYLTLYDNPLNLFVATFIGTPTINLFSGHVREHRWYGDQFGGYPIRSDLPDGSSVTLGIRGEHIRLSNVGLSGRVDTITPHFAERCQWVEVSAYSDHWTMVLPEDIRLHVGETITCEFDPQRLMYFDTQTEQRIG